MRVVVVHHSVQLQFSAVDQFSSYSSSSSVVVQQFQQTCDRVEGEHGSSSGCRAHNLLESDNHNKVWGEQAVFKIKNTNNKTGIYREGKAVKHVYRAAEDETEAVEQL
jgi:hypothetical protein